MTAQSFRAFVQARCDQAWQAARAAQEEAWGCHEALVEARRTAVDGSDEEFIARLDCEYTRLVAHYTDLYAVSDTLHKTINDFERAGGHG